MNTFGDRLKSVRGTRSLIDFASLLDVPKSTLSNYENNKTEPPFTFIVDFCKKFNVTFDWLFLGENPKNLEFSQYSSFTYVPLEEAVLSAGIGSEETDSEAISKIAFESTWLECKGNPKNMVCMKVQGDSMAPEILNKDTVLIDKSKKDILASQIYAVGFEDSIYIKRIEVQPSKIILKSTNKEEYPPIIINVNEYTLDQFRIIGKVLWVGREY